MKKRCFGNPKKESFVHKDEKGEEIRGLYALYHDEEWGRIVTEEQKLFEMLCLEGAQAGLSWETILNKREGYRQAFYSFEVDKVACMSDAQLEALRQEPRIVRNRLKIYAVRKNAIVFLDIQKEFGSFYRYLWSFVGGVQQVNRWQQAQDVPVLSEESTALSKDLKKRGMSFVGPTIMYSYMQAVGVIDDHLQSCWLRQESGGQESGGQESGGQESEGQESEGQET